jgi:hypothetical protein
MYSYTDSLFIGFEADEMGIYKIKCNSKNPTCLLFCENS